MIVHRFKQYSEEWWAAHRGRPSASNFNRIVTPAKWTFAAGAESYAAELIAEQFDYDYGPKNEYATAAMRNGTIMEPEARRYYEYTADCEVEQVGLCVDDSDRFIASPDGLCGEDGGLELKHPTAATHVKWLLAGVCPPEYLAQCHGSLLITKRKWWDFLSYYPGMPPLLVRIEPNEKTLLLAEVLERFWNSFTEMKARIAWVDPMAATREPVAQYF